MLSNFDVEALNAIIKDLYTVIGIRISIFDDDFNVVTEYPRDSPAICALIRTTTAGKRACKECDIAACKRAGQLGAPHVYECHAGITEAITPVSLGDGILGYAIFAHMLPQDNYESSIKNISEKCVALGLDKKEVDNALKFLTTQSRDKIMASMRLLDAIASYVQIKRLASWRNDDLSARIRSYIENNLEKELSSDTLCRQFYISRTKLYQLSKKTFGKSINNYIIDRRIEKVKHLLKTENTTVTNAAKSVGFDDYNYFGKLFKSRTGHPPTHYKNNQP